MPWKLVANRRLSLTYMLCVRNVRKQLVPAQSNLLTHRDMPGEYTDLLGQYVRVSCNMF